MRDFAELEKYTGPVDFGPKTWRAHEQPGHVVLVPGSYGTGSDTIADSNREAIQEQHPELPYGSCKGCCDCLTVDVSVCTDNDLETLIRIYQSLEEYPIYDESHYSDLEYQRLMDYVSDDLAWDLYCTLELSHPLDDVETWVSEHEQDIWECHTGSVDDAPIDLDKLALRFIEDMGGVN